MFTLYDTLILLIDNDINFLKRVSSLLEKNGFKNVKIASTCKKAITYCNSQDKPYLIITEFYLNAMTGLDFIQEVRTHCEKLQFIVLSKTDKIGDAFNSVEKGALSFIHKNDPWEELLIDSMKRWLTYYKDLEESKINFESRLQNITIQNYAT